MIVWTIVKFLVTSWLKRALRVVAAGLQWVKDNPKLAAWIASMVVAAAASWFYQQYRYEAKILAVVERYEKRERDRVEAEEKKARELEADYADLVADTNRKIYEADSKATAAMAKYRSVLKDRAAAEQQLRSEMAELKATNQTGGEAYRKLVAQLEQLGCTKLSDEAVAAINELEGVYR